MQAKNNLKLSYSSLMQNKSLALPAFLSSVLGLIFIFAAMNSLGLDFMDETRKLPPDIFNVNFENWIIAGILFLAFIISAIYLYSLSLSAASVLARKSKLDWKASFALTKLIIWKVIGIIFVTSGIIIVPVAVAIIFGMLFFLINKLAGILSLIAVIILSIIYIGYIILRLFFSLPILVLENKNVTESLKQSYSMTKDRLKDVVKIFGLIFLVAFCVGIASSIAGALVEDFAFSDEMLENAVYWSVTILTYLVNAFVGALTTLYLFHSYLDFSKGVVSKKMMKAKKKKSKK